MDVAFISVIRYDEDTIENMLIYNYNLGIRNFYITLHLPSTELTQIVDSTKNKLKDTKFNINISNHYFLDHPTEIYKLTTQAKNDGFKWIIASDGDELFVLKQHKTIQEFLQEYDMYNQNTCIHFDNVLYVPNKEVYPPQNCFVELKYRLSLIANSPFGKSIGKFYTDTMSYTDGLHQIINAVHHINVPEHVGYSCHFPDRNKIQVARKQEIIHNMRVERMKQGASYYGPQVDDYNEQLRRDPNFFNNIWFHKFVEPNINWDAHVYDPISEDMFNV